MRSLNGSCEIFWDGTLVDGSVVTFWDGLLVNGAWVIFWFESTVESLSGWNPKNLE